MAQFHPDLAELKKAPAGAIVPVFRRLFADHLTPLTAFELLGAGAEHAFLLESVVGNEKVGRHSFIATSPSATYEVAGGKAVICRLDAAGRMVEAERFTTTDPLADLQKLMPSGKYIPDKRLPAFTGGLVGFAGYDTIRYFEGEKLNSPPKDDRGLPDLSFGLYEQLVIFDHVDKTVKVVANADTSRGVEAAYREACARIDAQIAKLAHAPKWSLGDVDSGTALDLPVEANRTQAEFEEAVRKGKEYIRAGDIFQFVPSQRLRVRSKAAPLDVYRALRVINPSPFMFHLKGPSCTLIGASPEILVRVKDGIVTSRPLAGTRKRGATEEEDLALEKELLSDPKERAEHIMLVDLHRNDVGRVSETGSVKVDEALSVERYSHVMHITTNVSGRLMKGKNSFDALRVSLPVGTVSGAPKIRAMQIIDELEPTRRGPYGGAVGYIDFSGDMDTCIALRTIVWQDGAFDVQVGAGVVADSEPAAEYEETMNKARAMLRAVAMADKGF